MTKKPLTLLYIGGWGRSGSTLIGGRLDTKPGWVHVGEIWHLWSDSADRSALCSCRDPYRDCEFWAPVLEKAGVTPAVAEEMRAIKAQYLGTRNFWLKGSAWKGDLPAPLQKYTKVLGKLYHAIAEETGAQCLVDASKTPTTIHLLATLVNDPDVPVDPKVLHLIRDPRAVAYSWWFRPKARGPEAAQGTMARHSPIRSTLSWRARNRSVASVCAQSNIPRYELRYEDFTQDPDTSLDRLVEWVGDMPTQEAVQRVEAHSIRGNPIRFDGPARPIKTDETWRSELPHYWQRAVEFTAGPELKRYGYSKT